MVFSPNAGADEALGPFVFRIINILSICQFIFYLFPSNDMLTVFPIQMHWQPMFMAYTCLIVLDPEIPFTLPEIKGISGTDGAHY